MRRRVTIATFVLLLASMPVAAQHGMGHAGGGHAGFGGGHIGGFTGHSGFGHISGGMRSGGMRSGPGMSRGFAHGPSFSQRGFPQRSFSHQPFMHDGFRRHGHGRRDRDDDFRFRNNCFGFGCGFYYPYGYSGFYDPYWWWDSGSSSRYDEDYERDRALANQMNQQSLEEQRLRRQEDADSDQDIYNQPSQSRPAPGSSASNDPPDDIVPPTVLIFRDQHKIEVRNYAIVGQTLWSFSSPRTEKIPLADLDLAATTKANDERGLTFRVPAQGEAQ